MTPRTLVLAFLCLTSICAQSTVPWTTIGHDAQHTGRSAVAAAHLPPFQSIETVATGPIAWSTPVDNVLANTSGTLFLHYGTPTITAANTVLIPVRTTANNTFEVQARSGVDGTLKYVLPTNYTPPLASWVPSYPAGLSARNRFYYACAGGVVCYRDTPDATSGATGHIAFYGTALYDNPANTAAFNADVRISTPIVSDRYGNIFFGFQAAGANPASVVSGLARISYSGVGSWVRAPIAAADPAMTGVQINSAPAMSNDHQTVYVAINQYGGPGYLVSLNATTLTTQGRAFLVDPNTHNPAQVFDISSASPTVGPDGDVYMGVFESACCTNNDRGWMLHFDATLTQTKTPGAFGWDATASIVPRAIVPSYTGSSAYLIFTKYNNYLGIGTGNGANRVALLDPNATMTDPVTGATVMKEVATVLGATTEDAPPAVREWCINSAAIDIVGRSAIVNSEDGVLYRWDFVTNTLSEAVRLTPGVGEAYTPTVIGPDGTVYAINDAVLFAVR